MRTIKFKEVLWSCAYRIGLDPTKEFLPDQADALASYINGWVRRLYDSQDWPEWTKIRRMDVDPVTNLIPYTSRVDVLGTIENIGRVFKVYLIDPLLTSKPFDTPFRLTTDGIWPTYDHGGTVWVKYISQCPQFSATPWRADINYAAGALVYKERTGECYKSKVNNNLGHDPAIGFTHAPPEPPPGITPPPVPDEPPKPKITTETIQNRTPDDPGLVASNEILIINFDKFKPSGPSTTVFHVPDPPNANDEFYVDIRDPGNVFLGDAGPLVANGTDSLEAILAALAAELQTALGGTFVVTSTGTTIVVENPSIFQTALSFYLPAIGFPHYFPVSMVSHPYVPGTSGVPGDPQIVKLTLTEDQVSTGSIYGISLRGPDGVEHTVSYISQSGDSAKQILSGLLEGVYDARFTDQYFNDVDVSIDVTNLTLNISTKDVASINADIGAPASAFWEIQLIPFQMADSIIRGEMADVYREEGQTDRADGEEKKVETELGVATARNTAPDFLPLTDQQKPKSRFAIK